MCEYQGVVKATDTTAGVSTAAERGWKVTCGSHKRVKEGEIRATVVLSINGWRSENGGQSRLGRLVLVTCLGVFQGE